MKKSLIQQLALLTSIGSIMTLTGCQTAAVKNTMKSLQTETIDVIIVDEQSYEVLRNVTCNFSDDDKHTYSLNKNPGSVTVEYLNNKLYLSCQAPDHYQTQVAITNNLSNWAYNDLTILPGYVIDVAKFPPPLYPSKLIVFMSNTPLPSVTNADRQFDEDQKKEVFFQGTQAIK